MFFFFFFFFFNDTATTEIYTVGNTLSLHDASSDLPERGSNLRSLQLTRSSSRYPESGGRTRSEEHTSELQSLPTISYAVFCLKKKKKIKTNTAIKQIPCLHT